MNSDTLALHRTWVAGRGGGGGGGGGVVGGFTSLITTLLQILQMRTRLFHSIFTILFTQNTS